jgi:hypothetical protein
MRHSHYGDLQGHFAGTGWELFKRGWGVWLFAIASVLVLFVLIPLAKTVPALRPFSIIASLFAFFVPLAAPFLYAIYKAIEWRWWLSGIRFGDVSLESKLGTGALIGLYWKVIGWFVLIVTLFSAYLFGCAALTASIRQIPIAKLFAGGHLQGDLPMLALGAIGYLALILLLNVVMRVYLLRDVWAKLAASAIVHQIDRAADVAVKGDLADAVGEGLADGLDLVGF